jgi:hypothetical protein
MVGLSLLIAGAGVFYLSGLYGFDEPPAEPPRTATLGEVTAIKTPPSEPGALATGASKPVANAPGSEGTAFVTESRKEEAAAPQAITLVAYQAPVEPSPLPPPVKTDSPARVEAPEPLPGVPKGVEVLARGPVHEAFAPLVADPKPTKPIPKQPPVPLEEMPPAEKPEGNVVWISGYWAWDEDRNNFLWVSGTWRSPPPGKQWVAGYWREAGEGWQWVPGFWTVTAKEEAPQEVTYLPEPPAPPETAPPGKPPAPDTFYVPGAWVWTGTRYAWRAGFWTKVAPGFVWVPDHYRWTPSGYVFIPGYWDLAISKRGVLYAPVAVDPLVVTASFYYTPAYAVQDTVVVDALWVRPAYAHYYFGDYYEPVYRDRGFESAIVYSRTNYDPIVVYERYDRVYVRRQPDWEVLQINIYNDRVAGRAARPPRTLVEQNTYIQQNVVNNTTVINNNTVVKNTLIAPPAQVMAAKGVKPVTLDPATRQQAKQQAAVVQQVAQQRVKTEVASPGGPPQQPRSAALSVPKAQPVTPGFVAPKPQPQPTVKGSSPAPSAVTPAGSNAAKPGGSATTLHSSTPAKSTPPAAAAAQLNNPAPASQVGSANHGSPPLGTKTPGTTHVPDNAGKMAASAPGASPAPSSIGHGAGTPHLPGTLPGALPPGVQPRPGTSNAPAKQPPPPPAKRPPPKKDKDPKDTRDR